MKRQFPPDQPTRFSGGVKSYQRAGSRPRSSWDHWVGDDDKTGLFKRHWLRILLVIAALLGLGGVIAGLIIELGIF